MKSITITTNPPSDNMKHSSFIATLLLMLVSLTASSQRVFDVEVWQSKAPEKNGLSDTASMRVFLPEERLATGRAVLICPGGGYHDLSGYTHEGIDWAPFFNEQGIAAIVLRYRMPNGHPQVPVSDAAQAMRIIRANAEAWHVNPKDVGVMGSSAGGHLASVLATQSGDDARPDFQILFYPVITMMQGYTHQGSREGLLGNNPRKKDEQKYSSDMHVSRLTPRACIILADDDHDVMPMHGVNYYCELYRHDVPASLFVYPAGGHGFGIGTSFRYHLEMLLDLRAWLRSF